MQGWLHALFALDERSTVLLILVLMGCGDDSAPTDQISLVDHREWELVGEADDPFAADRPEVIFCDPIGYGFEDLEGERSFFVETDACNYMTAGQPALRDVPEGGIIHFRMFHDKLLAEEAASGHVALALGDETVWQRSFPIPSDAEWIDTSWVATSAVEAGDPVYFHVHNHGPNSWALIELSVASE